MFNIFIEIKEARESMKNKDHFMRIKNTQMYLIRNQMEILEIKMSMKFLKF